MQEFKEKLQLKLEATMELISSNPDKINKYIALFEQDVRAELARFNLLETKSFALDFLHQRAIAEIMDNLKSFVATLSNKADGWVQMIKEKNITQLERVM